VFFLRHTVVIVCMLCDVWSYCVFTMSVLYDSSRQLSKSITLSIRNTI